MPKFITIGYGDEAGYERTRSPSVKQRIGRTRNCASPGAIVRIAGSPVQVRTQPVKACRPAAVRLCVRTCRLQALP